MSEQLEGVDITDTPVKVEQPTEKDVAVADAPKAQDKNEWGSNLSFLLAMIGSAVGLGNIWRYPYVLYSSGGGVFYIPYLIAVFLMGIPFLILEYGVGYNFKSSFAKGLRKINTKFELLGWILPLAVFIIMIYYSTILGWVGVYVILSFYRGWTDDPKEFFGNTLLKASEDIKDMGTFLPVVAISMLATWAIIWVIAHRQLEKGLGKVSKVLVPLLFVIMIIIVIYSLTLKGASVGLSALFHPDWSKLKDFNIWTAAFGQIIFSLSLGTSTAFTYAGYSGKNSDLITNAVTIAVANCGFENFCALGVFSILGYMAQQSSQIVTKVVDQGTGLVFIAYPTVLNVLGKFSYVLGPAFFITVYLAGLTSILSMIEPISFCIQNKFTWRRSKTNTTLCALGALLSMAFATGYGGTLLGMIDTYINQICILLCVLFQCYAYAWAFKVERMIRTLNDRSKTLKIGTWWILIVKYILPIFIAVVWVGGIIDIIKSGSLIQTLVFIIATVVILCVSGVFTYLPPTNKQWNEVEDRL